MGQPTFPRKRFAQLRGEGSAAKDPGSGQN
jgi:hypothetical protein